MNGYINRVSDAIADVLITEGIDYTQSKTVFKLARKKAGLQAPKEKRRPPARLTLDESLRFIDQAYREQGTIGLMMQTLLETGTRVSEFTALRIEDVNLAERIIVIEQGKGSKRREVPIRVELTRLLAMHIGQRKAGPLFMSRQKRQSNSSRVYTRQRIGQIVRSVAQKSGITKRIYPHLLRHTMATRLLSLGMSITDIQKFLGHQDIGTTRLYAETSIAMLQRKFDQVTEAKGQALLSTIRADQGDVVGAFAADLLSGNSL